MANGVTRIKNAEMSRPKTPKGSSLKSALNTKTYNSALASVKGNEKQWKQLLVLIINY